MTATVHTDCTAVDEVSVLEIASLSIYMHVARACMQGDYRCHILRLWPRVASALLYSKPRYASRTTFVPSAN